MNRQDMVIIKDENDPAFIAQVERRLERAKDLKNSMPVDEFFRRRELRRLSEKLQIKELRHATV